MEKSRFDKKIRLYIIGVFLVMASFGVMQLVFYYYLSQSEDTSKVINLAGRQRMLSQKIAKIILSSDDLSENTLVGKEIDNWLFIHEALQKGNDSLGIPPLRDPEIKALFKKIDPFIQSIDQEFQNYVNQESSLPKLKAIVANNEMAFLVGMDGIVFRLDDKAENKIKWIISLNFLFFGVICLVLFFSYQGILSPFYQRLKSYLSEIKENEKEIQEQNLELNKQVELVKAQNEEMKLLEEELEASLENKKSLNTKLKHRLVATTIEKEQIQAAQKIAKLGYWSYDLKDSIYWSEAMYTIFDLDPKPDSIGPSLDEYISCLYPEDVEMIFANVERVQKLGELTYTHRVQHRSGEIRTVKTYLKILDNQEDTPVKTIFGVVQDVNEQVQKEQELEGFNESLKAVVNFSTDVSQDFDSSIAKVLKYTCHLLGLEMGIVSQIKGDDYQVLQSYRVSPEIQLENDQVFKLKNTFCDITFQSEGLVSIQDMVHSPYKGHPCYQNFKLESYIAIPLWVNKQKTGTLNFSSRYPRKNDFSSYEKDFIRILARIISYTLERRLYVKKLEELNRDQQNILHVVAHDLRAPFGKLYSLMDLIQDDSFTKKERQEFFQLGKSVYKQGMSFMEEMLTSFSIESEGEDKQDFQKTDISQLLKDFVDQNQARVQDYKLNLISSILPGVEAEIKVNSFKRALENLLSNALKFTPPQGEIHLSLSQDDHYFNLLFADTGIGMSENIQLKLFKRFSKEIRRAGLKGEKSNGLGMSIVKQIVEAHSGTLTVLSKEGKGTTFKIQIPFSQQTKVKDLPSHLKSN